MLYRLCPHCKQEKGIGDFNHNRANSSGLACWCKVCHREYDKNYKAKHTEERKVYQRNYDREHQQRRKELATLNRRKIKVEVLIHYGGNSNYPVCIHCGEQRLDCLSIDHIKGGGTQHRKANLIRGSKIYEWLRKRHYPEGYQTLCMNCQFIKRIENREN